MLAEVEVQKLKQNAEREKVQAEIVVIQAKIGYGRIYDGVDYGKELFRPADLYIVMNDEIPFEEDALRYGGKVRESTKQFWIDLLEEYKCKYYVVKGVTPGEQHEEILGLLEPMFQPIRDFVRE